MAKKGLKGLLSCWQTAWVASNKKNPTSVLIDTELRKQGFSILDILTKVAIIGKKEKRNAVEQEFLDFYMMSKAVAEQALVDMVAASVNGGIFLLKAKHAYKETQQIEQTTNTKVAIEWGTDPHGS